MTPAWAAVIAAVAMGAAAMGLAMRKPGGKRPKQVSGPKESSEPEEVPEPTDEPQPGEG